MLGSAAGDIVLQGAGVAPKHCFIENTHGTLTLHPCGNPCAIDGLAVTRPTRLSQGKEADGLVVFLVPFLLVGANSYLTL